jgi:hypothetical protein
MTPEKWEQVAELVEAALALAPAEREVFLGKACHKDSTLRAEVEALLSSYDKAEGFLDGLLEGATALPGDAEAPPGEGAMIGPYRIARELAHTLISETFTRSLLQNRRAINESKTGARREVIIKRVSMYYRTCAIAARSPRLSRESPKKSRQRLRDATRH